MGDFAALVEGMLLRTAFINNQGLVSHVYAAL